MEDYISLNNRGKIIREKHYHSDLACCGLIGKRWPSNLRTARASEVLSSANLKHLDRMSPTAGPPKEKEYTRWTYWISHTPKKTLFHTKGSPRTCKSNNNKLIWLKNSLKIQPKFFLWVSRLLTLKTNYIPMSIENVLIKIYPAREQSRLYFLHHQKLEEHEQPEQLTS